MNLNRYIRVSKHIMVKMKNSIFIVLLLLISSSVLAQEGIIRGKITQLNNNDPIPFATVIIQGTSQGTSSDIDGNYELSGLAPGLYNIEASFIGFKAQRIFEIEVSNSRVATVNIQLEEDAVELEAAEVVTSSFANRDEAPLSVRKIGINEVKRNPGGNRDISRAIRSLPGVASIPSFRNDIIIRGGAANENRFFIDGIEIPNINHFATQGASGGPVGLINVDFIQDVEFYSGAFPASRGNALSSVFDFGFKEGRTDRWSGNMVVGTSDIGLTLEGPTGDKSSIIMSARRSYLQLLFEAIGLPFLPTYNDFQFKWTAKPNDKNRITVLGLGAIDQFSLNTELGQDPTEEDYESNRYLLDVLSVDTQWNYTIGVKWDRFDDKGRWTYVASRNMLNNRSFKHQDNDESLPLVRDYVSQEIENKFRLERRLFLENSLKVTYGVNYEYAKFNNRSDFTEFSFVEGQLNTQNFYSEFDLHKFGAFFQSSKRFFAERLILSLGARLDANEYSSEMLNPLNQFSPRFSASYALTPRLSANFNTGIYYQLPAYTIMGYSENGRLVNRDNNLQYIRNKQLVAGLQYDYPERNTIITVEGFFKDYDQYPFSVDKGISLANLGADFGVIGNEEVRSISEGRSYGAELLVQQKLYKGWFGILAYTFVRSEFEDASGELRPSSWDSQHIVSLTGGKKLKRNWEVGFRFQLSGGLPFTPYDVASSLRTEVWDATRSGLIDYSRLNEERIDAFHQLDIRVDKKWFFDKWNLNVFLDIQNVYNQVTPLQPILTVQTDENGMPIQDPNTPGSYAGQFLDASNGNVLPAIGIILEL